MFVFSNFTSLGFSSQQLIETLSSRYQNIPTEFQIKAIPSLLQNQWYDLVLRAPAFSGKSVAILSSMLDNCIQNKAKNVRGLKQVFAIIVAPSNNSAVLLVEEALKLVESSFFLINCYCTLQNFRHWCWNFFCNQVWWSNNVEKLWTLVWCSYWHDWLLAWGYLQRGLYF